MVQSVTKFVENRERREKLEDRRGDLQSGTTAFGKSFMMAP